MNLTIEQINTIITEGNSKLEKILNKNIVPDEIENISIPVLVDDYEILNNKELGIIQKILGVKYTRINGSFKLTKIEEL